jgi:hypothetical protein
MGGAIIAGLVLSGAGAYANNEARKSSAGERKRRQARLFENQSKASQATHDKLNKNLNRFNAQSEKARTDKASEVALDAINRVTKATKGIKSGSSSLGVAGKTSSAKITKDASLIESEAQRNRLKNTALSNFLGLSGGQVNTGREFSNLSNSLNHLRTNARGQLAVDQASVLHSPQADTTLGDILGAAGTAVGLYGGISSITKASEEAAKQAANEAAKAALVEGGKQAANEAAKQAAVEGVKLGTVTTNSLGQASGGGALQGFAAKNPIAHLAPEFFKAPIAQFGVKGVQAAPVFQFGSKLPSTGGRSIFKNFLTGL